MLNKDDIINLSNFLVDLHCEQVIAFDISAHFDYANFTIVATSISQAHRQGVLQELPHFFKEHHLEYYERLCFNKNKTHQMTEWLLVDFHDLILHIMDKDTREFYELEKLWFESLVIFNQATSLDC